MQTLFRLRSATQHSFSPSRSLLPSYRLDWRGRDSLTHSLTLVTLGRNIKQQSSICQERVHEPPDPTWCFLFQLRALTGQGLSVFSLALAWQRSTSPLFGIPSPARDALEQSRLPHTRVRSRPPHSHCWLPVAALYSAVQYSTVQYSTLRARTINTPAANTADTATAKATQRDRRESKRRKESVSHQKAYITQPPLLSPSLPPPLILIPIVALVA